MLRYIFLSLFALLLLTACGGSDTDSSSNDSGNVFENTTGAKIHSKQDVVKLIETNSCPACDLSGANLRSADLTGAYLTGANLTGVNLTGADLTGAMLYGAVLYRADLTGANLTGVNLFAADLDGVIGADFTGALNVPKKYLRD